ncbi:MAG: hypothetical protein GY929_00660 [Actinomycetia bacterium]|nr:hypothetical protein [Actinomycetes bacterium]MCP5024769.1 hypothetical protein [Actinomycetes bacterium]
MTSRPTNVAYRRIRFRCSPTPESARKLLAAGATPRDVADDLGVSVPTLYRWVPAGTQPT